MRRRFPVLIGAACAAALLSAGGLVVAQTAPQRPGDAGAPPAAQNAPAVQPAPSGDLPPQESSPSVTPQPDAKAPAAKAAPDKGDSGDEDSDKVEAKEGDQAQPDPSKRVSHSSAVFQALDKITAETMRFEVRTGQSVRWKGLVFTLRTCETSAPDEPAKEAMAYLQVRSEPRAQSEEASREIFRGWMFASSPGLNPVRHPVYDAWLIACRA